MYIIIYIQQHMKFKFYTIVLFTTLQIQYGNALIKSKQKDVFFPVKNP